MRQMLSRPVVSLDHRHDVLATPKLVGHGGVNAEIARDVRHVIKIAIHVFDGIVDRRMDDPLCDRQTTGNEL